jgi:hypothetical protein
MGLKFIGLSLHPCAVFGCFLFKLIFFTCNASVMESRLLIHLIYSLALKLVNFVFLLPNLLKMLINNSLVIFLLISHHSSSFFLKYRHLLLDPFVDPSINDILNAISQIKWKLVEVVFPRLWRYFDLVLIFGLLLLKGHLISILRYIDEMLLLWKYFAVPRR